MNAAEMIMTGWALSADAFAASVCRSAENGEHSLREILVPPLVFGIFQAVMPLIGWLAGKSFSGIFSAADHWIAFGLLTFIGANAFFGAFAERKEPSSSKNAGKLLMTAAATSMDALAAGTGLAFADADMLFFCSAAGVITLLVCISGTLLGSRIGEKFGSTAAAAGGIVLAAMGIRILFTHLQAG